MTNVLAKPSFQIHIPFYQSTVFQQTLYIIAFRLFHSIYIYISYPNLEYKYSLPCQTDSRPFKARCFVVIWGRGQGKGGGGGGEGGAGIKLIKSRLCYQIQNLLKNRLKLQLFLSVYFLGNIIHLIRRSESGHLLQARCNAQDRKLKIPLNHKDKSKKGSSK